jgi:hypothetical protein
MNSSIALEVLAALRHQENTSYNKVDFIRYAESEVIPISVDEECFEKMSAWCFQVAKYCRFSPESVEIAMNMLARFLLTPAGIPSLQDRGVFQLASMTCLYTAIKIHEVTAMSPKIVSMLSQGVYCERDIERMEETILVALQYRLNPPTSLSFVRTYLDVIPKHALTEQQRQTALELADLQTQAATASFRFITTPASLIAYCSLLNSLEAMGVDPSVLCRSDLFISKALAPVDAQELLLISEYLFTAVSSQTDFHVSMPSAPRKQALQRRASLEESPRAVVLNLK